MSTISLPKKRKAAWSDLGSLFHERISTLEEDMKVIKSLIKQNNDTLTALMDASQSGAIEMSEEQQLRNAGWIKAAMKLQHYIEGPAESNGAELI